MSGPIVRTGTTPAFGDNWDRIFGGATRTKSKTASKSNAGVTRTAAKVGKAAKSAVAKTTGAAKSVAGKVKANAGKK